MAFSEKRLDVLLREALRLNQSERILKIVDSVLSHVEEDNDFRKVRDWLGKEYAYEKFPGNCHVAPNFALIIACLLLGGDQFSKALFLCVSSGWDTDCNAGNIGALNAIRLGLNQMNEEYDFRGPIADRFYCVSGDGESCVTDAVVQARRIVHLHDRLYSPDKQLKHADSSLSEVREDRFTFDFPGSVQGFGNCPDRKNTKKLSVLNTYPDQERGLQLTLQEEGCGCASTLCMWDPADIQQNYQLIGSPILYETQTVHIDCAFLSPGAKLSPYVTYYDFDDKVQVCEGPAFEKDGKCEWKIPYLGGMTIRRFGFKLTGCEGSRVIIRSAGCCGAPENLYIHGSLRNYDLMRPNMQVNAFTASARQFSFDYRKTFTVSDTENNGLVLIGNSSWRDYKVSCVIDSSLNDHFGIVLRGKGLRRYYAVLFSEGRFWSIIRKNGSSEEVLASGDCPYEMDRDYPVTVSVCGTKIEARFGGRTLSAYDSILDCGAAGFRVDNGTFYVSDMKVEKINHG